VDQYWLIPLSARLSFNIQGGQNSVITGGQFSVVISIARLEQKCPLQNWNMLPPL
jgi:hypothetical protein